MNKFVLARLAAISAAVVATAGAAHAEIPAGVATAITGYQTDAVTTIGLLMAAGIAIFAVKKLGQKMGWL